MHIFLYKFDWFQPHSQSQLGLAYIRYWVASE